MKIVREHINEKFTEKSDPVRDLGIGLSYPKLLLEAAMELFGDKLMFYKIDLKKGKQYARKGIPPYYEFLPSLHLSREEWSQLRKTIGKPIKKEYVYKVRVPYEGRNEDTLTIALLLDAIYKGDCMFAEQGAKVDVIDGDRVVMHIKPGYTYKQFYNEIKEYYES